MMVYFSVYKKKMKKKPFKNVLHATFYRGGNSQSFVKLMGLKDYFKIKLTK